MEKILIGLHEFEGPVSVLHDLPTEPGLLAILIEDENGLELLDIRDGIDIEALWHRIGGKYLTKNFQGTMSLAFCAMPELSRDERRRALSDIHDEFGLLLAA